MGRKSRSQQTFVEPEAQAPLALASVVENPPTEAAPTPVVEHVVTRWLVAETKRVSWYGHLTTLPVGSEVSLAEYGPEGVIRLQEQGVKLVPVI